MILKPYISRYIIIYPIKYVIKSSELMIKTNRKRITGFWNENKNQSCKNSSDDIEMGMRSFLLIGIWTSI